MRDLGKFILIIGVITTLVGLVMWSGFAPKWLGRLPGDIRIEQGAFGILFSDRHLHHSQHCPELAVVAFLDIPALKWIAVLKATATRTRASAVPKPREIHCRLV